MTFSFPFNCVTPTGNASYAVTIDAGKLIGLADGRLIGYGRFEVMRFDVHNARDYLFFALQIDYPGKLNPAIEVGAFCEWWELSDGDFYKALSELRNEGIVVSIANRLNLQFQSS